MHMWHSCEYLEQLDGVDFVMKTAYVCFFGKNEAII